MAALTPITLIAPVFAALILDRLEAYKPKYGDVKDPYVPIDAKQVIGVSIIAK